MEVEMMRRAIRLVWLVVALLVSLTTVAAVAAGGGGGGTAARTHTPRELRVIEAEMRLAIAERALDEAERQLGEGLITEQVRLERMLEVVKAKAALAEARAAGRTVTLELVNEPAERALALLFRTAAASYVLDLPTPDLELPRVTLTLNDVEFETAVRLLCEAASLTYRHTPEGVWTISPRADVVTVSGAKVPIIGSITTVSPTDELGQTYLEGRRILVNSDLGPSTVSLSTTGRPKLLTKFGGAWELIDLDVKDVPLPEVAARLAKLVEASNKEALYELEILVADSVPKDLKVTARIYKMRLMDVLYMLVDQANLTYVYGRWPDKVVQERDRHGNLVPTRIRRQRIHIVPRSELRVSGAGGVSSAGRRMPPEALERYTMLVKEAKGRADEASMIYALRQCPKCHAAGMLPGWEFCPHCGTKLPSERKPEEAAR
jgi:hypothetical protein